MILRRHIVFRALLLVAWATASNWCVAQPGVADEELFGLSLKELLDISISTATKRPENTNSVPASVTIVTRRDIVVFGYQTLAELLRNVPGMYLTDTTRDMNIGLRGIDNGGFQFLLNGVPQHPLATKRLSKSERARLNIPIEAIDRVEIVRGPMSVIYGNNAFQGAINIVTNDIDQSHSHVLVGSGNRGAQKLFARFAHEFEQGALTLNLGQYQTDGFTGDYADMIGDVQLDPAMHTSMAGDMTRNFKNFDASLTLRKFKANIRYSSIDYGIYALSPSFGDGNQALLETYQLSLEYDTSINDFWSVHVSGIHSRESEDIEHPDFLLATLHTFDYYQKQRDARTEFEINTLFDNDAKFDGVMGFRHRLVHDVENIAHLPPVADTQSWNQTALLQDAFFQIGYTFNEHWRMVVGNRWTRAHEYSVNVENLMEQTSSSVAVNPGDRTYSVPNIAAIFSLSDDHKIKLLYGEALQDHHSEKFSEPEKSNTLEVNYLSVMRSATLNVSLYQSEVDRIFRSTHRLDNDSGLYVNKQDNTSQRTSKGVEFQFDYRPIPDLAIEFSGVWQKTQDKGNAKIQVGESPKFLWKGRVGYCIESLTFGAGFYYVDKMNADYHFKASEEKGAFEYLGEAVNSALSFHANINYQPSKSGYFLRFHVENLFDEEIRNPANDFVGLQKGLILPGRQWTAAVGWIF